MKTQTIEQAIAAIEAAGHKAYGYGEDVKFYDPRKRGAFLQLNGGCCDKEFDNYYRITCSSTRKGGPSGAFCAEITAILDAHRKSL